MKAEQWCLDVVCADPILRWLWFILLGGAIFWTIMMSVLSKGFLGPASPEYPEGKRFSIMNLQLPFSHSRFRTFLVKLPAKALKPVKWSLWIDFIFMAFAYPLLACSAWYLLRNGGAGCTAIAAAPVAELLCWCIRLSFLAWLLDILENILTFSCLRQLSFLKSRALLLVALLKWCCVLFIVAVLLIARIKSCCG